MTAYKKLTPKDARNALWHKGILSYKLHKAQQEIYDFIAHSKDKTLVIYCHSGGRSAFTANVLRKKGFKAVNLAGGINAWSKTIDPSIPLY